MKKEELERIENLLNKVETILDSVDGRLKAIHQLLTKEAVIVMKHTGIKTNETG
jgi:hypothetical protein